MDDVLEKFGAAVLTTETCGDNKSLFEDLYKNCGKFRNQEERRKQILEKQKSDRNTNIDSIRGILDLVNTPDEKDVFKQTNKVQYRPNTFVAGFHKTPPAYRNVLMYSEWLVEKPEDLHENWYFVPCPKAIRLLVVASKGLTKCYTKSGQYHFTIYSALPAGNPRDRQRNRCCVLDCFYYEKCNIMFVLDILAWNSQPMTDGETEFRHFWLQSQLGEINELKMITKMNNVVFYLLPKIPCTPDALNDFMRRYPAFPYDQPNLDGLLFYHKKGHYVPGETPLVGWLFPFMVPEIIGGDITISKLYLLEKPNDYTNQAEFIQTFSQKRGRRQRKRTDAMDTSEKGNNQNNDSLTQNQMSDEKPEEPEESAKMDAEVTEEQNEQIVNSLQSQT